MFFKPNVSWKLLFFMEFHYLKEIRKSTKLTENDGTERRKESMNFGQNPYNWFLSNAQSLVLMAIVVIGIYFRFKREFSKLIGFLVVGA